MNHAEPTPRTILAAAGLKATQPRLRVLGCIISHPRPVSAKAVFDALLPEAGKLSWATIYRVLAQLEEAGVVISRNFDGEQTEFVLAERADHDHMICVDSGTILAFSDSEITARLQRLAAERGYELVPHTVLCRVRPRADGAD